jgi:F0F1-type ATP synthase assembly protein I
MDDRDNQAFEQRLAAAQAAEDAKVKREPRSADAGSTERAISLAMRLGVELVAAMAAGLRNLLRAGGRSTR